MEQNTLLLVNLYKTLGDKTDGNGDPILSIVQTSVTTVTTFMRERKFDPTTGAEEGPLDHEVDVPALDTSTKEVQEDLDAIGAIKDLVSGATAEKATPIKVISKTPIGQIKP